MSIPAPAFAPTGGSYTARTSYLTPDEYANAATGVDVGNLVPNGTRDQQAAALVRVLARASAWADTICGQILAATRDVQAGRYRVDRFGMLHVPIDFTPLVAVASLEVGDTPGTAVQLADLGGLEFGAKVLGVPAYAGAAGQLVPYYRGPAAGRRFVRLEYVNGYANTTLTAAAAAGATTLEVACPLALFPGMRLTIADGGTTEVVTIGADFAPTVDPAPAAVPLDAATTFAHPAGAATTALPEEIKEATILLASALIKTRGAEDFELPDLGAQVSKGGQSAAGGLTEVAEALDLLALHRRVI